MAMIFRAIVVAKWCSRRRRRLMQQSAARAAPNGAAFLLEIIVRRRALGEKFWSLSPRDEPIIAIKRGE
jgi:hypothetical protein